MSVVSLRLRAAPAPVGDFIVQRVLPQVARRFVGPFCFVDHFGPHTSHANPDGGVPPHPHIGLSTVTYLFDGDVLHRDSLGSQQRIVPGDVNWMTAGRGIVHSERPPADRAGQPITLHGLQVWVGLPTALEEAEPSFQHVPRTRIPRLSGQGFEASVVLGRWNHLESPVRVTSPLLYAVIELDAGASFEVPSHFSERAIYVVDGAICINQDDVFSQHEMAVLATPQGSVIVTAPNAPARVALFAGEPLDGPRYMMWNFVSSRRERLTQADRDWKDGRFAKVPGDS